jgi:hypothetical protein
MFNARTNVRFWGQSGTVTNRCLPISIYEYTALQLRNTLFRMVSGVAPLLLVIEIFALSWANTEFLPNYFKKVDPNRSAFGQPICYWLISRPPCTNLRDPPENATTEPELLADFIQMLPLGIWTSKCIIPRSHISLENTFSTFSECVNCPRRRFYPAA